MGKSEFRDDAFGTGESNDTSGFWCGCECVCEPRNGERVLCGRDEVGAGVRCKIRMSKSEIRNKFE